MQEANANVILQTHVVEYDNDISEHEKAYSRLKG